MRLLHAVAFSNKLPWFESTNVISFENATTCSKRMHKTLVATQLYAAFWIYAKSDKAS